jgi:serralysin
MGYFLGTDDDEYIYGADQADTIYGLGGDDRLHGSKGGDYINGGAGFDFASFLYASSGVYASLLTGRGYGGEAAGDIYVGIEALQGSIHNDVLIGDDNRNYLYGEHGDDVLDGRGGDDAIIGGDGNDRIKGGGGDDVLVDYDGNDTILGGEGEDTLSGGGGDDYLNGGLDRDDMTGLTGADMFVWGSTGDTGLSRETADLIIDFHYAEGDRIDLHFIDANLYAAGNQAFTFIGNAAFSGTPGEARYYHFGGDTYIELQTGTSADVEGVIRLDGIHAPQASWFVL